MAELKFASLKEQFPDGFFFQRHRPLVMPENHSHGHVEVLMPIGCSLTYLTQSGHYIAQDGHLSVLWGNIPHRVSEIFGDGEIYIANLPLPELLSWSMPDSFLVALFSGKLITADKPDPLDQLQFQRWINDSASADKRLLDVARLELQLCLRRRSLAGWRIKDPLSKSFEQDPALSPVSSRQSERVQSMIRYIAENYTQAISVDQITNASGLSKGHAIGVFKKMLGVNINHFLTQLRLHHAKSALADGDEKILTIALDAGFGSLSRFYEVFGSETGQTPQSWRRDQQKTD